MANKEVTMSAGFKIEAGQMNDGFIDTRRKRPLQLPRDQYTEAAHLECVDPGTWVISQPLIPLRGEEAPELSTLCLNNALEALL